MFVVSQIMRNREFEEGTRNSALEIISTCTESMPGTLRKNLKDLQEHFFPALAYMMTEVDNADDIEAWYAEEETEL